MHLTKTLAARWGRYDINVNSVSPDYVIESLGMTRSEDEKERIRSMTPLGRVQHLADLHGCFVFLASAASDYITGQNLVVDGGHTLSTWLTPPESSPTPQPNPANENPHDETPHAAR